jgi:hypothetical protein
MMDIFFNDPTDVPLPPDQVEIRKLTAVPNEEGSRVLLNFELTPFQERPNIEISVRNQTGKETASLSVVEAIEHKMDFTLHMKEPDPRGSYTLSMEVFYTDLSPFDQPEGPPFKEELDKNKKVVARTEIQFEIR